ncbi:hypothetical protein Vadar_006586 [Vaccinium darrowii]|uniref:Uncharacterized protein n=1 Tax=Vaccinium darrowii TaxID=229202 RepID=A0ACB7XXY5_9ERIC|nr:hypothetical protein Vadar_006586 [Vaccinium darrowii]
MATVDILDLMDGSSETRELSNHCLMGKVLRPKSLNTVAITNILHTACKTRAPFIVVSWNNNIFLFQFEEAEDRDMILWEGPWSVMNNIMIHGLPVKKITHVDAEIIGKRFGQLLALEANLEGLLINRSFLRVRAEINLDQPLPKGFWL